MAMTRGERVIAFIERYCLIPSGSSAGKPIKLEKFQKDFILAVYDNKHITKRAYLSIARKNGKTALIACLLLVHLVGTEAKLNSQIVSGAMSRDQAGLVFDLASKMVMLSKELSDIVKIVPSSKKLIGLPRNVEYKAISAEGKTAHGLSPVLAILDEVGQVRGSQSDFVDAIITAQGAYDSPLLLVISTQAPNDADLLSIWLDDAKESKDKHIVSHVYSADDSLELTDEKAWKQANPALATFRSIDDVKTQAESASRMPSFEATFRNLVLNQRVEMNAPFVSKGVWLLNSHDIDDSVFYEEPVYVGLDLSARNDLTAMVMVAYREKWHVKAYFWTPSKGLHDRAKRDRQPYDVWVNQGYIQTIEGASLNYEVLAKEIAEILSECNVASVAFDRWRIELLKKEFADIGVELPLVEFGQGYKDMSPALEKVTELLLNEGIAHGNNPVLTMCMANSKVSTDAAGNQKLDKQKATGRIDGAVAMAMAFGVCNAEETTKSFWETA